MKKRIFALVMSLMAVTAFAQADDYPSKPIRVVVPFGPGSGADMHGRFYADLLAKALKATVFVENKPGANGGIGMQSVKTAPPDGYSIAVVSPSLVVTPLTSLSSTYKLDDFRPVAGITRGPIGFFVKSSSRYNSLNELLESAKKEKRSISIGTYAGSYQIGAAWLSMLSGVPMTNIPYRGAAQTVTDLLGGSLEVMASDFNAMTSLVREGKLRPLAVAADKRLPEFPDVPTVKETYKEYENYVWIGLVVRADTPDAIVAKLSRTMQTILASKESLDHIAKQGWQPMSLNASQMAQFIASEDKRYKNVVKVAAIKPE